MTKEPTIQDVLEAVSEFSTRVDDRFGQIDQRFGQIDDRFGQIDDRFGQIDDRFGQIDDRFGQIDERSSQIDERFDDVLGAMSEFSTRVDERFVHIEADMGMLKQKIANIEVSMVTKEYLDSRLDALRGDLVALTRKLNVKLSVLVERLVKEGSLKQNTADLILALEPFAQ
jgi:archaellum component FlaC